MIWWNYWLEFILFSILSPLYFCDFSNNLYLIRITYYFLFLLPKLQMTLLLVICLFTDGTLFLLFNHSGLTESDSVIPLAVASLHLALPQDPSFLRSSKFMWSCSGFCSFWKALSWERLLVTFRYSSHIRCWASLCVHNGHAECCLQPSSFCPCCSVSWINSTHRMFSCSDSLHLCCCSSAPPQHACPQSRAHMSLLWSSRD